MKRHVIALLLAVFMLGGNAIAGPLDRTSESRTNPAVDDMLRIPGVVGLSRYDALTTLQQAGLNPVVKIVRDTKSEYEGMEGTVVSQSPNPGGVAMIGSTVSVKIYIPEGYQEQSYEEWQTGTYDEQTEDYYEESEQDDYQWEDSSDTNQYEDSGNTTDTPQWQGDSSGNGWVWKGPVVTPQTSDDSSGDTQGELVPAQMKPMEMQPYSPEENQSEKPEIIMDLKPKPLQRAQ